MAFDTKSSLETSFLNTSSKSFPTCFQAILEALFILVNSFLFQSPTPKESCSNFKIQSTPWHLWFDRRNTRPRQKKQKIQPLQIWSPGNMVSYDWLLAIIMFQSFNLWKQISNLRWQLYVVYSNLYYPRVVQKITLSTWNQTVLWNHRIIKMT